MVTTVNAPASTTQYELVTATGNIALSMALTATLTPVAIATITSAEQSFTITGLSVGDIVQVIPPGLTAGASLTSARVSAANTLTLTFTNPTAGSVTPLAGAYTIFVQRPYAQTITNGLPTSLPTA